MRAAVVFAQHQLDPVHDGETSRNRGATRWVLNRGRAGPITVGVRGEYPRWAGPGRFPLGGQGPPGRTKAVIMACRDLAI
ncbi:hypothetical protein Aca07nite_19210 [Actinoplanes capillaceus]|uniref:Uncharacterized protein n=1 Tax=Actinoplanes campanulatus TaxID=113559 RepID=A0ABQ3WF40_9ACTN|nr:hypothetical protein Aca07nite_19210 [Actinoplanes capillaceus]